MKAWMIVALLLLLPTLAGCYGRRTDRPNAGEHVVDVSRFGLKDELPSVVTFGALWCKPCRNEIGVMNQVVQVFGGKVQVLGLLVEGDEKGEPVTDGDVDEFVSLAGVAPLYVVQPDRDWRLFSSLAPANGKQLPLVALCDAEGNVVMALQKSLTFDGELEPLVADLVRGHVPVASPPKTTHVDTSRVTEVIGAWVERTSAKVGQMDFDILNKGWTVGLGKEGFAAEDMPFLKGRASWMRRADDETKFYVASAVWSSPSNCTLTVTFDEDGTVSSTEGICSTL